MASAIGKALGYSMDVPSADKAGEMDEGDSSDEELTPASKAEPKAASAEVLAMKQFERAKSPEAKVQALKDFLSACGYSSDDSAE